MVCTLEHCTSQKHFEKKRDHKVDESMLKVMKIVEATAGVAKVYHQIFELEKLWNPVSLPKSPTYSAL